MFIIDFPNGLYVVVGGGPYTPQVSKKIVREAAPELLLCVGRSRCNPVVVMLKAGIYLPAWRRSAALAPTPDPNDTSGYGSAVTNFWTWDPEAFSRHVKLRRVFVPSLSYPARQNFCPGHTYCSALAAPLAPDVQLQVTPCTPHTHISQRHGPVPMRSESCAHFPLPTLGVVGTAAWMLNCLERGTPHR